MAAVAHADWILELQSNLSREEMPPAWMWPFQKEMNEALDNVFKEREKRLNPKGTSGQDEGYDNELMEDIRREREGR